MMGFFGMGWLGIMMMLLLWAGVIVLAIALARALFPGQQHPSQQTALEILQRRYAAGEISAAEFEQARSTLGEGSTHG